MRHAKYRSFLMAMAPLLLAGTFAANLRAQSAAAPKPQTSVPQWQIDAGGKAEFDVASIKQDNAPESPQTVHTNVFLGPQDAFTPTGGLFSATNYNVVAYMAFAYKFTPEQYRAVVPQLPKWANSNRYDIEAHAAGNPTKDQYRLMMQALLAERFKLTIHYETRQVPGLALVLDKPGKTFAQFRPHKEEEGKPCSSLPHVPGVVPQYAITVPGGFPEICGVTASVQPSASGRFRVGARAVTMAVVASSLGGWGNLTLPLVDKTGLTGTFDFVIEFTPQINGPLPPGSTFQPDPTGPSFLEALKEQLGLKLESRAIPMDAMIVDHLEEPSAN